MTFAKLTAGVLSIGFVALLFVGPGPIDAHPGRHQAQADHGADRLKKARSAYAELILSLDEQQIDEGQNADLNLEIRNAVSFDVPTLIPPGYRHQSLKILATRLPDAGPDEVQAEPDFDIHNILPGQLFDHAAYQDIRWSLPANKTASFDVPLFDNSTSMGLNWLEPGRYALHAVYHSHPPESEAFQGMHAIDWSPIVSNGVVLTVLPAPDEQQAVLATCKAFLLSEPDEPKEMLAQSSRLIASGLPAHLEKRVRWRTAVLAFRKSPETTERWLDQARLLQPLAKMPLTPGEKQRVFEMLGECYFQANQRDQARPYLEQADTPRTRFLLKNL